MQPFLSWISVKRPPGRTKCLCKGGARTDTFLCVAPHRLSVEKWPCWQKIVSALNCRFRRVMTLFWKRRTPLFKLIVSLLGPRPRGFMQAQDCYHGKNGRRPPAQMIFMKTVGWTSPYKLLWISEIYKKIKKKNQFLPNATHLELNVEEILLMLNVKNNLRSNDFVLWCAVSTVIISMQIDRAKMSAGSLACIADVRSAAI